MMICMQEILPNLFVLSYFLFFVFESPAVFLLAEWFDEPSLVIELNKISQLFINFQLVFVAC